MSFLQEYNKALASLAAYIDAPARRPWVPEECDQLLLDDFMKPGQSIQQARDIFESMPLCRLQDMNYRTERLNKIAKLLPDGAWIAGGFLRCVIAGEDELDGDIDFYFRDKTAFEATLDMVKYPITDDIKKVFGYYNIKQHKGFIECESSINYRPNLQFITLKWYPTPIDVIKEFDFTVCQFITDGKQLYCNSDGWKDIKTKTLNVYKKQDAMSFLNRLLKYRDKGYKFDEEQFKQVVIEAKQHNKKRYNTYSVGTFSQELDTPVYRGMIARHPEHHLVAPVAEPEAPMLDAWETHHLGEPAVIQAPIYDAPNRALSYLASNS